MQTAEQDKTSLFRLSVITCSCRAGFVSLQITPCDLCGYGKNQSYLKKMKVNGDSFKMKQTIHLFPLSVFTAGIVATAFCATISHTYWDFLGLLLVISLASSLSGAVFGFLFGIPRLNRNYDPRDDYDRTTKYKPNTNLEDVSDWLTKIIIGVTLTQLTKIPGYLQSIADAILRNSDCETMNCHFARPMIISLIIYFLIAGFMTGYIYTRIYLVHLFSIMEENRIKEAELSIWREGVQREWKQMDKNEAAMKIASLTEEEMALLQTIKRHNNSFTGQQALSVQEQAAMNVLVSKGILKETQEYATGRSRNLTIADNDVLHELNGVH